MKNFYLSLLALSFMGVGQSSVLNAQSSNEILTAATVKNVRSFANGTVVLSVGKLKHRVDGVNSDSENIVVVLAGKNEADCAAYARAALVHDKKVVISIVADSIAVNEKGHYRIKAAAVKSCAIR